ncbi:hypothetical protein VNI00_016308 [Paramarasmius palmivorus]|uniref:DUF6535 domain-containing protein n=1 Tax=Paramarasmius palmivorus TaxID=297713 RepID=A0AAW0BEY5_9AGAR
MDKDLSREDSERRQKEERTRKAYEQLGRDLEKEHWEQKEQKWDEEESRKKEKKTEEEEDKWKKEVVEPAYEKLQAEVKKYDDGMIAGYKEDIDTLLVFAGLFSAVVTAFLIESYQWLSEDTTVIILTQISQQLNGTQTQLAPFTPEASSIRINCFWFLSLIFSLTSALFGLLCKQWLREHQRDVPTRTSGEDLALRQLRRDSFEKWGVASFLSALPILLELALVFFFVGVLDLLWTLQHILFGICFTAISLSVGLYFLTTILPTITISRDQAQFIDTEDENYNHHHDFGQLAYQFICPYKSPQAWAVYKLFTTLPKPLLHFPAINNFTKTHLRPLWDHVHAQTSTWSTFDLRVVRQFDQKVFATRYSFLFELQVYKLRALQWAVTMFRDSPSMVPHLENVLKTLPRSVAISTVLDRWDIAMWEGSERDVGKYLRYPTDFLPLPKPVIGDPLLHFRDGIELLFLSQLGNAYVERFLVIPDIFQNVYLNRIEDIFLLTRMSKTLRFCIPVPLAIALWSHKEPQLRQLGLRLLRHYEDSWKPSPGYDEERHNQERVAFVSALVEHIMDRDQPSVLLTSKKGQEFIRFIHNEFLIRQLYRHSLLEDDWIFRPGWLEAIQKVQRVGKLPDDYFAPLGPRRGEDLPPSVQPLQLESIQYSLDTVRPQPDDPGDEDEESSLSHPSTDNVEKSIEIQVHRPQIDTTGEVPDLAGDTLIPGSADQGGSGLQAINESDPLRTDNGGPGAPRRTVAEGAEPNHPNNYGAQAAEVVHLSARDDEPAVPTEAVSPDTDPDQFTQATEDGAQATSSSLERQGEPAGVDHGEQGIVNAEDITADFDRGVHTVSDNISLVILEPPDLRVAGTGSSRQGDSEGGDGVSGRIGWNPTNDPNDLRVHWFRP